MSSRFRSRLQSTPTSLRSLHQQSRVLATELSALFIVSVTATLYALPHPKASFPRAVSAVPDAAASRQAFLQIYRVFTSPRCQNCHPAGDAPLQGDDSHVHLQNVKRGDDGHGVYGMRCDTCHQSANLVGEHMPPGNPRWSLPPSEHKMVFVGRTPAQLCQQLKDPKQNGGRTLQQIYEHVSADDLVGWAWNPGEGRSLPPLTRAETSAQLKAWVDGGAACPQ